MKKILTTLIFLLIFCSVCFADMTAEEKAYFRAKEPSNDPIVGFWKGFRQTLRKENEKHNEEYFVMLTAPEDRPEWDYVMVALEAVDSQKPGEIIALFRKTENKNVYFVKAVVPGNIYRVPFFMPVIYSSSEGYFSFRDNPQNDIILSDFVNIIIKIDDHTIPEIEAKYPPKRDESWREILAPAK